MCRSTLFLFVSVLNGLLSLCLANYTKTQGDESHVRQKRAALQKPLCPLNIHGNAGQTNCQHPMVEGYQLKVPCQQHNCPFRNFEGHKIYIRFRLYSFYVDSGSIDSSLHMEFRGVSDELWQDHHNSYVFEQVSCHNGVHYTKFPDGFLNRNPETCVHIGLPKRIDMDLFSHTFLKPDIDGVFINSIILTTKHDKFTYELTVNKYVTVGYPKAPKIQYLVQWMQKNDVLAKYKDVINYPCLRLAGPDGHFFDAGCVYDDKNIDPFFGSESCQKFGGAVKVQFCAFKDKDKCEAPTESSNCDKWNAPSYSLYHQFVRKLEARTTTKATTTTRKATTTTKKTTTTTKKTTTTTKKATTTTKKATTTTKKATTTTKKATTTTKEPKTTSTEPKTTTQREESTTTTPKDTNYKTTESNTKPNSDDQSSTIRKQLHSSTNKNENNNKNGDGNKGEGSKYDENGNRINENGELVDEKGRLINKDGKLIDKNGYLIDQNGKLIDKEGYRIDENGDRIGENSQSGSDPSQNNQKKNSKGDQKSGSVVAIVLGTVGGLMLLILVILICVFFVVRSRKEEKSSSSSGSKMDNTQGKTPSYERLSGSTSNSKQKSNTEPSQAYVPTEDTGSYVDLTKQQKKLSKTPKASAPNQSSVNFEKGPTPIDGW